MRIGEDQTGLLYDSGHERNKDGHIKWFLHANDAIFNLAKGRVLIANKSGEKVSRYFGEVISCNKDSISVISVTGGVKYKDSYYSIEFLKKNGYIITNDEIRKV